MLLFFRYDGIVEVTGSIPVGSTKNKRAWRKIAEPFNISDNRGNPTIGQLGTIGHLKLLHVFMEKSMVTVLSLICISSKMTS